MKRSEMLKFIEGLFGLAPKYPNDLNAENLLTHLEELGMLPPERVVTPEPEDHIDGFYPTPYITHTWEPE